MDDDPGVSTARIAAQRAGVFSITVLPVLAVAGTLIHVVGLGEDWGRAVSFGLLYAVAFGIGWGLMSLARLRRDPERFRETPTLGEGRGPSGTAGS